MLVVEVAKRVAIPVYVKLAHIDLTSHRFFHQEWKRQKLDRHIWLRPENMDKVQDLKNGSRWQLFMNRKQPAACILRMKYGVQTSITDNHMGIYLKNDTSLTYCIDGFLRLRPDKDSLTGISGSRSLPTEREAILPDARGWLVELLLFSSTWLPTPCFIERRTKPFRGQFS